MNKKPLNVLSIFSLDEREVAYLRSLAYNKVYARNSWLEVCRYLNRWELVDIETGQKTIVTELEERIDVPAHRYPDLSKSLLACPQQNCRKSQPRSNNLAFQCSYCSSPLKPFWQEHIGWHLVTV